MRKCGIWVLALVFLLLSGCATERIEQEFVQSSAISVEDAFETLRAALQAEGYLYGLDQHLSYEGEALLEGQNCYIYRLYEDYSTHRVTTGWYAVDLATGACFDTRVMTELVPLDIATQPSVDKTWQTAYKEVLYAYQQSDSNLSHAAFSVYDAGVVGQENAAYEVNGKTVSKQTYETGIETYGDSSYWISLGIEGSENSYGFDEIDSVLSYVTQ